MKFKIFFIIFILFSVGSCSENATQTDSIKSKDAISFKGKVVFNSFEGGFWGVVTDSGDRLDGTVPEKLRVKDLRVKGKYAVKKGKVSFHMWGKLVEFVEIKKE